MTENEQRAEERRQRQILRNREKARRRYLTHGNTVVTPEQREAERQRIEALRVRRDVCWRCQTRTDLGCKHQRPQ